MKSNIQSIYNYLIELNLLSQNLIGNKLIEATQSFELDISPTIKHINRVNKAWENISLNFEMNLSETVKQNLLLDIEKAKDAVSEDLISCKKFDITNTSDILKELSTQLNRLMDLEDYINHSLVV